MTPNWGRFWRGYLVKPRNWYVIDWLEADWYKQLRNGVGDDRIRRARR